MSDAKQRPWYPLVSLSLKIGLVLALGYAAYDYFSRPGAGGDAPAKRSERPLQADLYVYPAKTNITSYATAQRLVGMDLWTKEGWRWTAQPDGMLLEPLEKVTPKRVYQQGGELRIEFEKGGRLSWLAVGTGGRVFVDEVFFIEDPQELYSHWSPEDWERIRGHESWQGMTEHQAIFSLGYGRPLSVSPGGTTRVVEFPGRPDADPTIITFREGFATEIR